MPAGEEPRLQHSQDGDDASGNATEDGAHGRGSIVARGA